MDWSLPGSFVHGIFQPRVLEWVAIAFSRGSSQPRDQTQVSCIAGRRFTIWATREAGGTHVKPIFKALNFSLNCHRLPPAQTSVSKGMGPLSQHLRGAVDLNER